MARRMLVLGAVVGIAALLPAAHTALAAPPARVNVCHLNSSSTPATLEYDYSSSYVYYWYSYSYEYHYTYTYSFGNVTEVSESAVSGHEGHGDSRYYGTLDQWTTDYFESWSQYSYSYSYSWDYSWYYGFPYYGSYSYSADYNDANVRNADCYVWSYTQD